jgi:excisionase family DNA binding protein
VTKCHTEENPNCYYYTVNEVAKNLRVSKMTVYRMISDELITYVRVGRSFRIPACGYEEYVDSNTRENN